MIAMERDNKKVRESFKQPHETEEQQIVNLFAKLTDRHRKRGAENAGILTFITKKPNPEDKADK